MVVVSLVLFVRLLLAVRACVACMDDHRMRTLALILNFVRTPNINYREITSLIRCVFSESPSP